MRWNRDVVPDYRPGQRNAARSHAQDGRSHCGSCGALVSTERLLFDRDTDRRTCQVVNRQNKLGFDVWDTIDLFVMFECERPRQDRRRALEVFARG